MRSPPGAGRDGCFHSPAPSSPCHGPAFLGEVRLEAQPSLGLLGLPLRAESCRSVTQSWPWAAAPGSGGTPGLGRGRGSPVLKEVGRARKGGGKGVWEQSPKLWGFFF